MVALPVSASTLAAVQSASRLTPDLCAVIAKYAPTVVVTVPDDNMAPPTIAVATAPVLFLYDDNDIVPDAPPIVVATPISTCALEDEFEPGSGQLYPSF
jgi:hypothetical protein